MTVQRHLDNPFWATALDRMDDSVAGIVRGLDRLVRRSPALQDLIWPGSGWRPNSAEHNSGCAIDMILVAVGHRPSTGERAAMMRFINEVLIPHWRELGIRWILFSTDGQNRTQSWNPDRGYWKNLDPRGGVSADHIDHVHILFHASASWPTYLETLTIGGPTAPAPKPKPAARPRVSLQAIRRAATLDPKRPQGGTTPGAADDVRLVEDALRKEGLLSSRYAGDGSFGTLAVKAYSRWQQRLGYRGRDADGIPGKASLEKLGARHGFDVTA